VTAIYLITGFLGSGKTTFLNERLNKADKKVGVLMNEFGKTSMDTITVQKEGMSLIELTNGSIFCSCLKEHFIQGLVKLLTLNLDELYIESSGLSDPSNMGNVLQVVGGMIDATTYVYKGSICLIDGVYFKKELEKMVSVERQIKHSHVILINKTDLISKENIEEITTILKQLNSKAHIIPISYGKIDWSILDSSFFPIEEESSTNTVESKPRSILLTFVHEPTRSALEQFLQKLGQYFYRVKGFISINNQWFKIDQVNERLDIVLFKGDTNNLHNELVFLSSQGIESISQLALAADAEIPGLYRLKM
jgi:G3E family GTPase